MKAKITLAIIYCLAFQYLYSQKTGGGELNPGIHANQKSLENFQNLRFGLSIHWGPNVIAGQEISWSRGKETPAAETVWAWWPG
ncbi:MAG: hypothetical protein PF489_01870 [Salinivirgaceae bacterium]|jgi:alpha-L-fucosidase|nr:hypothetical protein [Salinivirgaceae bacterium]